MRIEYPIKITDVVTSWIKVPYEKPFEPTWYPGKRETHQHILLVRVLTDEGLEGLGCAEFPFGLTMTVMQFIHDMVRPWLIGQDPMMIEKLACRMKGDSRLAPRPWVVENALWDLMGKICHQPTYKVLGAYRDKIPAYAAMCELRDEKQRQEDALRLLDEGFRAVKLRLFKPTMKEDIRIVENIREAVGDKMVILCDANQGPVRDRNFEGGVPFWTYQRALETARALHDLDVLWLEEPLDHYDFHSIRRLTESTDIAIAGGEIMNGIQDLTELIDNDCYDIYMPNITLCCGISQVRKIAAMAERRGNKLCNIHGWVPGTGVAAALATICSYPNATWLEYPHDPPAIDPGSFQGIVKNPIRICREDGCLHAPSGDGFGVELDEDKVKAYTVAVL